MVYADSDEHTRYGRRLFLDHNTRIGSVIVALQLKTVSSS